MKTYQYRIKDASRRNFLRSISRNVNHVWNLAKTTRDKHFKFTGKYLSAYELQKLIKLPEFEGGTAIVQQTIYQYVQSSIDSKKPTLRSRSYKKNLDWIPCTNQSIRKLDLQTGDFKFMGQKFRIWYDRSIRGSIRTVSFSQDAQRRWYVNFVCEDNIILPHSIGQIGIDLGCKTQIACSDGMKYSRENFTFKYAEKLAKAQRAKKKKQTRKIYSKIHNKRKDFNHKATTEICNNSEKIVVGDITTKQLTAKKKNKGLTKSLLDASHYEIKSMLKYKSIRRSIDFELSSEKFSTITCSDCLQKTGPKGLSNLRVREWVCSNCGVHHDRDVNAAKNILSFSLRGIVGQKGIQRKTTEGCSFCEGCHELDHI
jgi:putative transposase